MLAIFKTGGKQYSAKAGEILKVEKIEGSKGDKVSITDVLAISDQNTNSLGEPLLKDASIVSPNDTNFASKINLKLMLEQMCKTSRNIIICYVL